jgi:glycosyltransferase involved in cell wall biosynthesis
MIKKIHSLVIPTRNRQEYISDAVKLYLSSPREDIEIIVVDNSDDPSLIKKVLGRLLFDRRLTLIESENRVLSMKDNWQRGFDVTQGLWVTYIGDDDICDPNLVNFLEFITGAPNPPVVWEAIGWVFGEYTWPELALNNTSRPKPYALIPLKNEIKVGDSQTVLKGLLSWANPIRNNGMGPSLYHGAIKRSLLDRICKERGGKIFDLETVDFDTGYAILKNTEKFIQLSRPFTIMGSASKSNSASVNTFNDKLIKSKRWFEEIEKVDGFSGKEPPPALCIAIHLWHFNQAWMERNGVKVEPNRFNYVKGIEQDCNVMHEVQYFEEYKQMLTKYLKEYGFSDLLKDFNPVPYKKTEQPIGLYNDNLYVDPASISDRIGEFAKVAFSCMVPWNHIGKQVNLARVK